MNKKSFSLAACLLLAVFILQSNKCEKKDATQQTASADMDRVRDSMLKADSLRAAYEAAKRDSVRIADAQAYKALQEDSTLKADSAAAAQMHQHRPHPPALPVAPAYKEGRAALDKFLTDNTRYPEQAKKNNITGFVVVSFLVKTDGTLTDFRILKSLGYGCDEEALRVAKLMPPWNPGRKDGKTVAMEMNVTVKFGTK
ncbi:MAG: energy transducer TonB [Bacteroidetes bacterium]|nr:energy transducer TonB [Bacteroidota bacterium]